eukprot:TRINITY_DN1578_c0_g1_i1.p1 TRINITY_DN1578_c0_g1~~TRINITY_DN1578_c0_g1_i1.p1  ORF type:complete len:135 (-),score=41.22 TRINITY_DN1578_c0_g1_i1:229-633(-)
MSEPSPQEIIQKFQTLRSEVQTLSQKIAELDSERSEHALVLDATASLPKDRKCYRLVGGVLVERTLAEVMPAVEKNRDQIATVVKQLSETLQRKQEELNTHVVKYKISIRRSDEDEDDGQSEESGRSTVTGVLV